MYLQFPSVAHSGESLYSPVVSWAVADPGFAVEGGTNLIGVPTPKAATFSMSKRKN